MIFFSSRKETIAEAPGLNIDSEANVLINDGHFVPELYFLSFCMKEMNVRGQMVGTPPPED